MLYQEHEQKLLKSARPTEKLNSSALPQFPFKLHEMLDEAEGRGFQDVISWLPCGKSFRIHDSEELVRILKVYFNQTKFKSFLRQLQNYGFERIARGPRKGTCTHKYFIRGRRSLCVQMKRVAKSVSDPNLNDKQESRGGMRIFSVPDFSQKSTTRANPLYAAQNAVFDLSRQSRSNQANLSVLHSCNVFVQETDAETLGKAYHDPNFFQSFVPNKHSNRSPVLEAQMLRLSQHRPGVPQEATSSFEVNPRNPITSDMVQSTPIICTNNPTLLASPMEASEELNQGRFAGKRFFVV